MGEIGQYMRGLVVCWKKVFPNSSAFSCIFVKKLSFFILSAFPAKIVTPVHSFKNYVLSDLQTHVRKNVTET